MDQKQKLMLLWMVMKNYQPMITPQLCGLYIIKDHWPFQFKQMLDGWIMMKESLMDVLLIKIFQ